MDKKSSRTKNSINTRLDLQARVTAAQTEVLCSFFENNPEVLSGCRKTTGTATKQAKWKEIANILNTLGPPKSHKAWAKYLTNMKNKLKKKHIKWRESGNGTEPVIGNVEDFDLVKLRMLQVLRNEEIKEETNEEESNDYISDSEAWLLPEYEIPKHNQSPSMDSFEMKSEAYDEKEGDEFTTFGLNVAHQLRFMPRALSLETQDMLMSVLRSQREKAIANCNKKHSQSNRT